MFDLVNSETNKIAIHERKIREIAINLDSILRAYQEIQEALGLDDIETEVNPINNQELSPSRLPRSPWFP